MRSNKLYVLIAVLVLFSLALAACQPAVQQGGEATQPPAAEESPAGEESPAAGGETTPGEATGGETVAEKPFEPLTYSAPDCEYGGIIKEIASPDAQTVVFTLCVPDPAFPSKAAFSAFSIQPTEWIEAAMQDKRILEHPIGTGPYMLESWNRGDSIVMTAFPDYWGDKPATDKIIFRWSTEGAARLLELQSGTVDGIDNPSPDDFETIRGDANLQLIDREVLNTFYVGITNTFDPFTDVRVREALAMGIDRQRIVDNFYPAGSQVASHFTPCAIPNGCTGDDWYEFDPEAAKELLAEAGFADGFETTIYYRDVFRSYLPEPGLVATDLQAQLEENLGITAEVEVMESGAFIEAANAGNLEGIYLLGWNADYPHITNFLDFHFGASNPQFGDVFPEIYEPLAEAAQIGDPAEAESLYTEANNAIRELVPMVPIAHGGSGVAYRADVENAHASPLGNEFFGEMVPGDRTQFVWMQNNEPISLYCNDETDGESLRACEQILQSLLSFTIGGTEVEPGLATSCDPNEDLTQWTCNLRENVKFHNGSTLDATDVVTSWVVAWDAAHPLHVGNTGQFQYFSTLWGALLNAPPATE